MEVLPVGFHNLINFINFTVQTAGGYEPGQFPAKEHLDKTVVTMVSYNT